MAGKSWIPQAEAVLTWMAATEPGRDGREESATTAATTWTSSGPQRSPAVMAGKSGRDAWRGDARWTCRNGARP